MLPGSGPARDCGSNFGAGRERPHRSAPRPGIGESAGIRIVHMPYVLEQGRGRRWCANAQLRPGSGREAAVRPRKPRLPTREPLEALLAEAGRASRSAVRPIGKPSLPVARNSLRWPAPDQGRTAHGRAGCARPRPAALPARSAGRQPRLPRSDRRLPPRPRAQLGIGAPNAVLVLFQDVRHMDYADPCRFSDTRSAARIGAVALGQRRTIADPQSRAGPLPGSMANRTGSASTRCRRRSPRHGDAQRPNLAHIRLYPVTRGLTPFRVESDYRTPEGHAIWVRRAAPAVSWSRITDTKLGPLWAHGS